jgi:hypothetical protein
MHALCSTTFGALLMDMPTFLGAILSRFCLLFVFCCVVVVVVVVVVVECLCGFGHAVLNHAHTGDTKPVAGTAAGRGAVSNKLSCSWVMP